MENATKALLMAAGVLIGIVILALGVYLYLSIGGYVKTSQEEINNQSLAKFNIQFYNYTSEKNTLFSFQDVVSIANVAYENNSQKELLNEEKASAGTDYVEVLVFGVMEPGSRFESSKVHLEKIVGNSKNLSDWLSANYATNYTCEEQEITLNSAKRVNRIVFRKNE